MEGDLFGFLVKRRLDQASELYSNVSLVSVSIPTLPDDQQPSIFVKSQPKAQFLSHGSNSTIYSPPRAVHNTPEFSRYFTDATRVVFDKCVRNRTNLSEKQLITDAVNALKGIESEVFSLNAFTLVSVSGRTLSSTSKFVSEIRKLFVVRKLIESAKTSFNENNDDDVHLAMGYALEYLLLLIDTSLDKFHDSVNNDISCVTFYDWTRFQRQSLLPILECIAPISLLEAIKRLDATIYRLDEDNNSDEKSNNASTSLISQFIKPQTWLLQTKKSWSLFHSLFQKYCRLKSHCYQWKSSELFTHHLYSNEQWLKITKPIDEQVQYNNNIQIINMIIVGYMFKCISVPILNKMRKHFFEGSVFSILDELDSTDNNNSSSQYHYIRYHRLRELETSLRIDIDSIWHTTAHHSGNVSINNSHDSYYSNDKNVIELILSSIHWINARNILLNTKDIELEQFKQKHERRRDYYKTQPLYYHSNNGNSSSNAGDINNIDFDQAQRDNELHPVYYDNNDKETLGKINVEDDTAALSKLSVNESFSIRKAKNEDTKGDDEDDDILGLISQLLKPSDDLVIPTCSVDTAKLCEYEQRSLFIYQLLETKIESIISRYLDPPTLLLPVINSSSSNNVSASSLVHHKRILSNTTNVSFKDVKDRKQSVNTSDVKSNEINKKKSLNKEELQIAFENAKREVITQQSASNTATTADHKKQHVAQETVQDKLTASVKVSQPPGGRSSVILGTNDTTIISNKNNVTDSTNNDMHTPVKLTSAVTITTSKDGEDEEEELPSASKLTLLTSPLNQIMSVDQERIDEAKEMLLKKYGTLTAEVELKRARAIWQIKRLKNMSRSREQLKLIREQDVKEMNLWKCLKDSDPIRYAESQSVVIVASKIIPPFSFNNADVDVDVNKEDDDASSITMTATENATVISNSATITTSVKVSQPPGGVSQVILGTDDDNIVESSSNNNNAHIKNNKVAESESYRYGNSSNSDKDKESIMTTDNTINNDKDVVVHLSHQRNLSDDAVVLLDDKTDNEAADSLRDDDVIDDDANSKTHKESSVAMKSTMINGVNIVDLLHPSQSKDYAKLDLEMSLMDIMKSYSNSMWLLGVKHGLVDVCSASDNSNNSNNDEDNKYDNCSDSEDGDDSEVYQRRNVIDRLKSQSESSLTFQSPNVIIEKSLGTLIQRQCKAVNLASLHVMLRQYCLLEHIDALETIYLVSFRSDLLMLIATSIVDQYVESFQKQLIYNKKPVSLSQVRRQDSSNAINNYMCHVWNPRTLSNALQYAYKLSLLTSTNKYIKYGKFSFLSQNKNQNNNDNMNYINNSNIDSEFKCSSYGLNLLHIEYIAAYPMPAIITTSILENIQQGTIRFLQLNQLFALFRVIWSEMRKRYQTTVYKKPKKKSNANNNKEVIMQRLSNKFRSTKTIQQDNETAQQQDADLNKDSNNGNNDENDNNKGKKVMKHITDRIVHKGMKDVQQALQSMYDYLADRVCTAKIQLNSQLRECHSYGIDYVCIALDTYSESIARASLQLLSSEMEAIANDEYWNNINNSNNANTCDNKYNSTKVLTSGDPIQNIKICHYKLIETCRMLLEQYYMLFCCNNNNSDRMNNNSSNSSNNSNKITSAMTIANHYEMNEEEFNILQANIQQIAVYKQTILYLAQNYYTIQYQQHNNYHHHHQQDQSSQYNMDEYRNDLQVLAMRFG